jgi:hypothetical protein
MQAKVNEVFRNVMGLAFMNEIVRKIATGAW